MSIEKQKRSIFMMKLNLRGIGVDNIYSNWMMRINRSPCFFGFIFKMNKVHAILMWISQDFDYPRNNFYHSCWIIESTVYG